MWGQLYKYLCMLLVNIRGHLALQGHCHVRGQYIYLVEMGSCWMLPGGSSVLHRNTEYITLMSVCHRKGQRKCLWCVFPHITAYNETGSLVM
jgi:hypothetical protein